MREEEKRKFYEVFFVYMIKYGVLKEVIDRFIGDVVISLFYFEGDVRYEVREFVMFFNVIGRLNVGMLGVVICLGDEEVYKVVRKMFDDYKKE